VPQPPRSSCPACGGPLSPWRTVPSSEPQHGAARFTLERCGRCASAVTVEPAAPDAHETGAYRPGEPRLRGLASPLLRAFDRRRLRLLRALVPPPARLLDVGAGRGRFVAAARAAGYAAQGLEPSARGTHAAAAAGIELQRATVAAAELPEGAFEAVTLWHVLEHLDEPGAALERVRGWLSPGGALLVAVPNLDSVQARLGGERWYHLDVPRHRVHFTPRGLEALLRSRGLEPVLTAHVLAEHNPFGMWQSLVNHATGHPSYLYNLLKRNAPLDARDLGVSLAALPLAPAAAALELCAGLARRGGTFAVGAVRGG
jgi:2-polyprenyl-3-methyl-5-hydroxy-6-metoxy-1,4-benzoquinol methylase